MTDLLATDLSLRAALSLIADLSIASRPVTPLPLERAAGAILAADMHAAIPLPGFDHAAVDGWAVRLADCAPAGETRLPARGRLAAGQDAGPLTVAGAALRIMTGAMLPQGAEAVVMQEIVRREGDGVVLPPGLQAGQNIRRRGEQAEAGAVLLRAGRRLRPADLALAAAGGIASVPVRAPLRVGVLSTGDEVRPIGASLPPFAVHDQNGVMLAALLQAEGTEVIAFGAVEDDAGEIALRLAAMAECCDLIVTTGGVSVGEEDHLRAALRGIGRLLFWRVAMKPGRPTALGLVGAVPLLALPGHPTAAFTAFRVLGRPLLRRCRGEADPGGTELAVKVTFAHLSTPGFCEFLPVTLTPAHPYPLAARPDGVVKGLRALVAADALVRIEAGRGSVAIGDALPCLPLH